MRKQILSFFKVLIPLGFGVFLIYLDLSKLSTAEKDQMIQSMLSVNYVWLTISLLIAILSHAVRAYRWNYLTEPMGFKFSFWNALYSVFIGYFANLAIPRLGEIIRCTMVAKYEKQDFAKIFGTIIVERLFDLLVMMFIMLGVILTQLDLLHDFLENLLAQFTTQKSDSNIKLWILLFIAIAVLAFIFLQKSQHPIIAKIKALFSNLWLGIQSIFIMQKKVPFILLTLLIWVLYILAMYTCFLSFEMEHITLKTIMTCFVVGGLSIALTQGGLGLYPIAIMGALSLYGIEEHIGRSMGWLMWSSHTGLIIVLGIISLILLPIQNRIKA